MDSCGSCGWLWVVKYFSIIHMGSCRRFLGGCGCFGWLWMLMGRCGWLWVVVGGCGWLFGYYRWLLVVGYFNITHYLLKEVRHTNISKVIKNCLKCFAVFFINVIHCCFTWKHLHKGAWGDHFTSSEQ